MANEMDGAEKGRRNIVVILVVLGLFDIIAIVLLAFYPDVLAGARGSTESIAQAQEEGTEDQSGAVTGEPEATEPDQTEAVEDDSGEGVSDEEMSPEEPEDERSAGDGSGTQMPDDLSEIDPIPASSRELLREYQVVRTDTFFELTGQLWEDVHLWPDLYVLNSRQYPDPDFIQEGSTIQIYEKLGSGGELSPRELATLLDAYVRTYVTYRELGEHSLARGRETGSRWHIQLGRVRINKAHWLLYSGLRFDRDFLKDFSDRIQDRDERVVRQFIDRFGYPGR